MVYIKSRYSGQLDHFLLLNHVLNEIIFDVYLFDLTIILKVLCLGKSWHAITLDHNKLKSMYKNAKFLKEPPQLNTLLNSS